MTKPEGNIKTSVLFVCMGNICRSPTAEAVFRHQVKAAGFEKTIYIDSAGTHDFHVGEPPDPDAHVSLDAGGHRLAFRLPHHGDLALIEGDPRPRIAAACVLTKGPMPDLSDADLSALAAGWEALDPAGSITVSLCCVGCQAVFDAAVDPALFVARDLDLFADALLRDIDCIATRYRWPEAAILALPPVRRLHYVALIQGQGGQTPLREVRR